MLPASGLFPMRLWVGNGAIIMYRIPRPRSTGTWALTSSLMTLGRMFTLVLPQGPDATGIRALSHDTMGWAWGNYYVPNSKAQEHRHLGFCSPLSDGVGEGYFFYPTQGPGAAGARVLT